MPGSVFPPCYLPGAKLWFGEGNGNPLQYPCLENPMDRGVWWATVHGVTRVGHELVTKPPPLNYGGGNEDNGHLLQMIPCMHCYTHCPQPCSRPPVTHAPPLETPGQVWVSLFWGHCSFLLGPSAHKVLFVPSKSLFPQTCVSSDGSMVG